MGFLGPNGAGKSTTIRILLDLIRPTTGTAEVLGHDCQADGVAARGLSGYLPGDLRLYESWTGAEIVGFVASLRRSPVPADEVTGLAARLDIDLSRRSGDYSKGNRQKLGLMLALAHRPEVLILDEPTSGLDPIRQRTVWEILRERADEGAAVLLSSHVMSEVETVCDRVAVLRRGRVLRIGSISELLDMTPARLSITFEGARPDLGNVEGVSALTTNGQSLDLAFVGDPNDLIRHLAASRVADITVRPPRLDDVVLQLYEREKSA
jgi:ABC-2 type transport system ATP-binding protein